VRYLDGGLDETTKGKSMVKGRICILCCLFVAAAHMTDQLSEFPTLTGPYLGQKLPDNGPLVFAPGLVSNGANASSPAIAPDGHEIYWDVDKIWFTKLEKGRWTKPELVPFNQGDRHLYRVPCFSPDGQRLYFLSTRPGSVSQDKENIWYAERTSSGWSDPKPLSPRVNALRIHWNISVSGAGTVYFQGTRPDQSDSGGIYYSRLDKGEHAEPVRMGPEINSPGAMTTCPYVAPDESFLVFNSLRRSPEDSGIFISFSDGPGRWRQAVRLIGGSREIGGLSPRLSPDGKYLFYVNENVFWMPIAKLIDELRPKDR
jgi:hypothetical protein